MASVGNTTIRILRSQVTQTPTSLESGEQAYSYASQKLFVGNTNNTAVTIGGQYYTNIIDSATAQQTNSKLVLRDAIGGANIGNVYLSNGSITFSGNIVPLTDNTQSLGSPTNRFRDLYVGPGSVFVDNIELANTDNKLTITGTNYLTVGSFDTGTIQATLNSAFTVANIAYDYAVYYDPARTQLVYDTANTGWAQANGAYANANSAFAKANSAFDQANSAFAKSNSANILAQSAYTNANSGFIHASAGYNQANSAYAQASGAYANANSGFAQANSAYGKANSANILAQSAFSNSNSAFTHASAAYNQANNAYSQALTGGASGNNAYTQANTAYAQANTAWNTANSANAKANSGFDQANSAFSKANSANILAQSAYTQANLATAHATGAYANANSAFAQANAAFANSNSAYTLAYEKVSRAGDTMTGHLIINNDLDVQGYANLAQTIRVGSTPSNLILPDLIAQFTGDSPNYSQVNQQNINANGSGDFVVTGDNGTDTVNYIDMGFAGSTYSYEGYDIMKPNDGYILVQGNDASSYGGNLTIGTVTTGRGDIVFHQGGSDAASEVARFAFDDSLQIKYGTAATDTTSGALQVTGGAGFSGNIYASHVHTGSVDLLDFSQVIFNQSNTKVSKAGDTMTGYLVTPGVTTTKIQVPLVDTLIFEESADEGSRLNLTTNNATLWVVDKFRFGPDGTLSGSTVRVNGVSANLSGNVYVGSYQDFNASVTKPSVVEGRIFYDKNEHALAYFNDSDMTLQIGQESVVRVFNGSGKTISDGKVVRIIGAIGNFPSIDLADAATHENSIAIGVTTTSMANGTYGYVTQQGKVNNLNTLLYTPGTEMYLGLTPGTFTDVAPNYPALPVRVGYVAQSSATTGSILVSVSEEVGVGKTANTIAFFDDETVQQANNLFWRQDTSRLGINQSNPNFTLDVVGDSKITGNLIVTGNLTAANILSVSTSTLTVVGNTIVLAQGTVGVPVSNAEIVVNRGSETNARIIWWENGQDFVIDKGTGVGYHLLSGEEVEDNLTSTEKQNPPSANITTYIWNRHLTTNTVAYNAESIAIAGFNQANAAWASANAQSLSAYAQASGAYANANAAYAQANTAYTQANVALAQAQARGTVNSVSISTGAGISSSGSPVTNVGSITIENTGVVSIAPISTSRLTSNSQTGNVGIDLATVGSITAGTYTYPYLHVDSYGRIDSIENQTPVTTLTANSGQVTVSAASGALSFGLATYSTPTTGASNGYYIPIVQTDVYGRTSFVGNTAIPAGTTSVSGIVQLTDSVSSTSITTAATPNSVKAAFDFAQGAFDSANNVSPQIQPSFNKANNAGDIAAAAFTQANVALSTGFFANVAWDHANSAYNAANNVTPQVQPSFDKANAGYALAQSGFDQANSAFAQANTVVVRSLTANNNQLTANGSTGNLVIGLAQTTVTPTTYGGADKIPVITVDEFGRLSYAANVSVTIPSGTNVYANATQLTANASTGNVLIGLANVNSTIGTYGGTSAIPIISVDGFGRVTSVTTAPAAGSALTSSQAAFRQKFVALANQKTFTPTSGFESGFVDVYLNGFHLSSDLYTDVSNTSIVLASSVTVNAGDVIDVVGLTNYTWTPASTFFKEQKFVDYDGQTYFTTTATYIPGAVDIFLNGLKLVSGNDYVALSGTDYTIVNPPLKKDDVIQITAHTTSTMAERFQYKDSFVASAGQTVFTTTFPYVTGLVDVYVDGFYLSPDDYYATDGTTVNITGFALGGGEKVVIVLGASYPASNSFILSGGTVSGNVSVTGTLGTAQTLSVAQSATVTGNTTIGGWLSVASNSSVGGALTIGSYSTVAANLTVGTNATISGNATIGGNTTIGGTANVTGNVFTSGSITINTDATIRGNTTINGSATISGNMTCGIANVATYIKFPDGTTQVSASGSRATSILIGLIFGG